MSNSNYITAAEFMRLVFFRLKKYRYLILISALAGGSLLGLYIKSRPVSYISKATLFSLSNTNDNPTTSSALSMLLGTESSKSFSDETSINILELAQSRTICEAVAASPVPSMGNTIIASLLIEDMNKNRNFITPKIVPPKNKEDLIILGGRLIKTTIGATINKNNSFILTYSGRNEELIRIISYKFIDKISEFYIDIKREKAKRDYEFATNKVDSLRRVMGSKDYRLIAMDRRSLFTNTDKLEFKIPAENLEEDKQLIRSQYTQAVINQQTAAYKLQRDTPLIRVLDKPDPPYEKDGRSAIFYGIIGFLTAGLFAGALISINLFLRYTSQEISRALFGSVPSKTTTSTAQVL